MNEQVKNPDDVVEIDLKRLIDAVLHKAWVVSVVSVLCAVLVLVGTLLLITPVYESSAMFYVNNNSLSVGDASFSIDSGDITASKSLVDSYIVILNTRSTLADVMDYAGVSYAYRDMRNMITAESVNDTEIFEVVVTSPDPQEAEQIANAIAYILPKRISSIVEGTSAKVVDAAVVAARPSSPSYTKNTVVGFLLGFMLSVGIIVLQELFDVTIRSEEDITNIANHPVLAAVPDMLAPTKGGYYYGYGNTGKAKRKQSSDGAPAKTVLVGSNVNFAAAEAYKLLRTKLQYSFADENTCRVIGVSSAMTGEGKSLTSVNLAFTLSQLGARVILIDCDMRRPSLQAKLPISKKPGLSGFLSGQVSAEKLIQPCGLEENPTAFHVIASGQNPPNPVELLSSTRMSKMLKALRTNYDYIILDLPPIGEVSDALSVSKETDGILLVVRQDYCNRKALASAVRQFEFVGSRILGIMYNCASESGAGYSKDYYKRYSKYNAAAASAKDDG